MLRKLYKDCGLYYSLMTTNNLHILGKAEGEAENRVSIAPPGAVVAFWQYMRLRGIGRIDVGKPAN
jgi:hypothetical protein